MMLLSFYVGLYVYMFYVLLFYGPVLSEPNEMEINLRSVNRVKNTFRAWRNSPNGVAQ